MERNTQLEEETIVVVACLGPKGTFSDIAQREVFGNAAEVLYQRSIADVVSAVARKHCPFGIIPIENSTSDVVKDSLDAIIRSPLLVARGSYMLPVRYGLFGTHRDAPIRRLYARGESFAQTEQWVGQHFPDAQCIAVTSSAEALVRVRDADEAAIAAYETGCDTKLALLAEGLQDQPHNETRFYVIGEPLPEYAQTRVHTHHSAFIVTLPNRSGAFCDLFGPIAAEGLNTQHIHSRTRWDKPWEYFFLFEVEADLEDVRLARALTGLRAHIEQFRVIGSV